MKRDNSTGYPTLKVKSKKIIYSVGLVLTILTVGKVSSFSQDNFTISGRVHCQDIGIANVVVTDGFLFTTTNANGEYSLDSEKKHGYIFITIPSGYEPSGRTGIVTPFFKHTTLLPSTPEKIDFELTKIDNINHTLLVMTDAHFINGGDNSGKDDIAEVKSRLLPELESVVAKNKAKNRPLYFLLLGDIIEDLYWDSFGYSDYLNLMKELDVSAFHTIGNHEYSVNESGDWDTAKDYKRYLGPTYYSFNLGKIHYVVLDNMICTNPGDGKSRSVIAQMDDEQTAWLKQNLSYVDKDTPIVVALHVPVMKEIVKDGLASYSIAMKEGEKLNALFEGYKEVYYLTGHTHVNSSSQIGNILERNIAAVSGSWWFSTRPGLSERHICNDGSPGGYQLYAMNGDTVTWQYKGLGIEVNKQFRTYDRNQIHITAERYCPNASEEIKAKFDTTYAKEYAQPSDDNYVYINIWGWDPKWELIVKENGIILPWTRIANYDPLKILTYEGIYSENNLKVFSYPTANYTSHFFQVKASSPDTTLEIKVTDRFGNVYTETMKRPKKFDINID